MMNLQVNGNDGIPAGCIIVLVFLTFDEPAKQILL